MTIDHNQILYSSTLVSIGIFDCPLNSPDFVNTGPICDYLLAFPRTAVKIRHVGMLKPIIADPNIVTIYNKGQEYERYPLSGYGDYCNWLAICPSTVCETLADTGITKINHPERLFDITHAKSSAKIYALFKSLVNNLISDQRVKAISIEETALYIFQRTVAEAYAGKVSAITSKRRTTSSKHRKLVRHTQELLATRFSESLSLETLASEMNTSPFHLCRLFRRLTGFTIHQYLTQLRLRTALHHLSDSSKDLATLGVNMGFSDHSHFSSCFRGVFGTTPSAFRRAMTL